MPAGQKELTGFYYPSFLKDLTGFKNLSGLIKVKD
jgi:hypothetical protein